MEKVKSETPTNRRSSAQIKALEAARKAREVASARTPPEGYRSVDHFLSSVREQVGRIYGGNSALAKYLDVNESSVRKWLKGEKLPMQTTIDAMALWVLGK